MSNYEKKIGRLLLRVSHDGARMHDYGHGCHIECPDGWNDSCPIQTFTVSVEELRDLRYMLDRAIALADETSSRCKAS